MFDRTPLSIITRSPVPPHPDDRLALWRQKFFIRSVRSELRESALQIGDKYRGLLASPHSSLRLPELDRLLDFLALRDELQRADRLTVCSVTLTALGLVGVLALAMAGLIFLALLIGAI